MARYMGGPRGRRDPSPPGDGGVAGDTENSLPSKHSEGKFQNSQDDSGLMQKILIHQSIEFGSDVDNIEDEESNESPDSRLLDSTDEPEPGVRELENDGMGTNEDSNLRRNQHRSIFGAPHRAPMFPKLPISSRSIGNFDRDDTLPLSTGDRSGSSRTSGFRQRTPTPGIDIEYNNPNSSGKFIFEPPPLSISYGWMAKGTNEHVEDLHLSGVLFCDEEVQSEKEIEVLCEYTWIEATPGRAEAGNTLSTIYVPGNTRNWRGLEFGSTLKRADLCDVSARTIRDEHAILQSQYPYEPTFRALEVANADTSLEDIDIITDVDSLTKLLAFICGPRASETPVTQPFRLDLSSVRNTLFILTKEKPGRGYTGPLRKQERRNSMNTVPQWAAPVLNRIGSDDPKLPCSGGHYRLVRYRFGNLVLAVREKVDFVHEHHSTSVRFFSEAPDGDMASAMSASTPSNRVVIGKTTVDFQGPGTHPDATGTAAVRYDHQRPLAKLNEMMPQLWFSRTRFLVEGVVDHPALQVQDASIVDSQQYYRSFERGHRCSLRHLAGLLRHLQRRTCELGGNTVVICDPTQVCLVVLRPVIKTSPVPEDIVLKFWGPEESFIPIWALEKAATPGSESDLTDLGTTPTPPQWFSFSDLGETATYNEPEEHGAVNCNPMLTELERMNRVDPLGWIGDWRANALQATEDDGYEPDVEDNISSPFTGGGDGYTTETDDNSIRMGQSTSKIPCEFWGASDEDPVTGREQGDDDESVVTGGYYQQESSPKVRAAYTRRTADEGSRGEAINQMQRHHMGIILDSEHARMEQMAMKSNGKGMATEVEGNGTPALSSRKEQQYTPDNEHDLGFEETATHGGEYRHLSSSDDRSPATTARSQQMIQSRPRSASVNLDTNLRGAATPHMD